MKSRIPPLGWILFVLLCVVCLVVFPGCATSSRVRVSDGPRSAEAVLPKNYRATGLDLSLSPDGTFHLKAASFDASASKVIDSTAGAVGHVADAAKSLAPLVK